MKIHKEELSVLTSDGSNGTRTQKSSPILCGCPKILRLRTLNVYAEVNIRSSKLDARSVGDFVGVKPNAT
jgi:hypothetical protein